MQGFNPSRVSALANHNVTGNKPPGKPCPVGADQGVLPLRREPARKAPAAVGSCLPSTPGSSPSQALRPGSPRRRRRRGVSRRGQPLGVAAGPYLLRLLDHLPHHLLQVGRALLLARVREEGHPADAPVEGLVGPTQIQRGHLRVRALGPVGQREGLTAGSPRRLAALPGVVVSPPAAPQGLQLMTGEKVAELLLPQGLPVGRLAPGHQRLQGPTLLLAVVEASLGLRHLLVDVRLVQQKHLGFRHPAGGLRKAAEGGKSGAGTASPGLPEPALTGGAAAPPCAGRPSRSPGDVAIPSVLPLSHTRGQGWPPPVPRPRHGRQPGSPTTALGREPKPGPRGCLGVLTQKSV